MNWKKSSLKLFILNKHNIVYFFPYTVNQKKIILISTYWWRCHKSRVLRSHTIRDTFFRHPHGPHVSIGDMALYSLLKSVTFHLNGPLWNKFWTRLAALFLKMFGREFWSKVCATERRRDHHSSWLSVVAYAHTQSRTFCALRLFSIHLRCIWLASKTTLCEVETYIFLVVPPTNTLSTLDECNLNLGAKNP